MKGLLLLSGGIDSPVAGLLVKKAGHKLIAVHFATTEFTGDAPTNKTVALAEKIGVEKLFVVDVNKEFAEIAKSCNHKLYFVLTKRLMVRIANELAKQEGCAFLVTGENLGQVSSQTLTNLSIIEKASELPVLRPLLAMDKTEIMALARKFGTFETSKGPEFCDVLGPKHPATKASESEVEDEEHFVEIGKLVISGLEKAKEVETA